MGNEILLRAGCPGTGVSEIVSRNPGSGDRGPKPKRNMEGFQRHRGCYGQSQDCGGNMPCAGFAIPDKTPVIISFLSNA